MLKREKRALPATIEKVPKERHATEIAVSDDDDRFGASFCLRSPLPIISFC
jgi:hypothetical protein